MSAAPDLRQVQELLWTLITAPDGVRPALQDLARRGLLPSPSVDDLLLGDERLGAADRLDIYANMYFFRLLDCVREDFPRVAAALGHARFHALVARYLQGHPSESPSLRYLGRRLPEFVAGDPLGAEVPYLADLARLEWARVEAFDVPDARPLSREDLARLPQETVGERRIAFVPSLAVLEFAHDVVRAWNDLQAPAKPEAGPDDPAPGDPAPVRVARRRTRARVWRNQFVVYHRSVSEEEARCLDQARAGGGLARICQDLAAGRSVARATTRVGRLLQGWIDDGILLRLDLPA